MCGFLANMFLIDMLKESIERDFFTTILRHAWDRPPSTLLLVGSDCFVGTYIVAAVPALRPSSVEKEALVEPPVDSLGGLELIAIPLLHLPVNGHEHRDEVVLVRPGCEDLKMGYLLSGYLTCGLLVGSMI